MTRGNGAGPVVEGVDVAVVDLVHRFRMTGVDVVDRRVIAQRPVAGVEFGHSKGS